ncbi:MAG TPA: trypsin-like peptidase domain-containing protein [Marmoricola sp.]|nr:trypsin-like peptidase domain-containing protein [Marmoricola sp.]
MTYPQQPGPDDWTGSRPDPDAGAVPGPRQHPAAERPRPYAWESPYGQPVLPPPAPHHPAGRSTGVPGWTWPVIALLALVLGLGGGAIGGYLVADSSGDSGGLLEVQRRTAPPLEADNRSIAAVAAKVLPSTVQIIAEYQGKPRGATGSGFVLDERGHVITNNHVVAEAAADDGPIQVIDQDGNEMKASVVGRSAVYDIAVLKVRPTGDLVPAAIGSSQQMRVGETVVAFGSPLGLSATVTSGIISAVNRPVTTGDGNDSSFINAVQTDAAINPGNSGGPLVNLQGQVIGVNSAIASLGSLSNDEGGNIGVGFAIPIEQVQVTTDQILRTGEAKYPVIGATVRGTEDGDGATVQAINPGSPAASSQLRVGDTIVAVDGKPVTGSTDLVVAIRTHQPGEQVTLTIRRDGQERDIDVGLDGKVG